MEQVKAAAARQLRWEREHPDEAKAKREAEREAYRAELRARLEAGQGRGEVLHRMSRLGVPAAIMSVFSCLSDTPALLAAKAFHKGSQRPWLALLGGVGTGKSVAAAWLLAKYLQVNPDGGPSGGNPADLAMWVSAPELDAATEYRGEHIAWVERLCRARFLVLDDVGTERIDANSPTQGQLMRVVNARHGAKRRTVLTSNLRLEDFATRGYDARLLSRLQECAEIRAAKGPDMRGGK